jgi:glucose-6-phosphate 1-dehydrogenase
MPRSDCDAIVLFGATGDLCYKKIYPALYHLTRRGLLTVPVIGVSRKGSDLNGLIRRVRDSLEAFVADADEEVVRRFTGLLRHVDGDYNNRSTFVARRQAHAPAHRPRHNKAKPPSKFAVVGEPLCGSGSATGAR